MITLNVSGFKTKHLNKLQLSLSKQTGISGIINVRLLDSEDVAKLNKTYAGKDEPTDVLSFNYQETPDTLEPESETLGDVVINRQYMQQQAQAAGTDVETEFVLLLLHGSLHILGFDHQTSSDRRQLDKLQHEIMGGLGLVYRDFNWQK